MTNEDWWRGWTPQTKFWDLHDGKFTFVHGYVMAARQAAAPVLAIASEATKALVDAAIFGAAEKAWDEYKAGQ